MTSVSDLTTARYVVVGTAVLDRAEGRIARFLHSGVAQLGADWLNGPDATPEDYQWSTIAHTLEDGIETYALPSRRRPDQRSFVSRVDDGPWQICPAQPVDGSLSMVEAVLFVDEIDELRRFALAIESKGEAK